MINREKVINALQCCLDERQADCAACYQQGPGFGFACREGLMRDALTLLKEQEAREPHYTVLGYLMDGAEVADDALTLLKENNECENCAATIEDRQLVIKCKDCKHHRITDKTSFCSKNDGKWSYNDFCSKGERK